jgi:hypothetical protein
MRRVLRRSGVLATFLAALALTVAIAEPASAGKAKGLEKNGSKAAGGGPDEPPGLVGNVHAKAKGHAKVAQAAAVDSPQAEPRKQQAKPKKQDADGPSPVEEPKPVKTGAGGGRSTEAHHHLIVCHRTGSASNPYVVINIPWTAWSEAHDPDSGHAHPPLDGRVDLVLKDPASRPGGKDGFTKADCAAADPVTPPAPPPPAPPATDQSGGALGEEAGSRGQGQLPFTGLPLLIALLAALGAAVSAAGVACGTREQRKGLQRRPRQASHCADVRHVATQEPLDGTPDNSGSR